MQRRVHGVHAPAGLVSRRQAEPASGIRSGLGQMHKLKAACVTCVLQLPCGQAAHGLHHALVLRVVGLAGEAKGFELVGAIGSCGSGLHGVLPIEQGRTVKDVGD